MPGTVELRGSTRISDIQGVCACLQQMRDVHNFENSPSSRSKCLHGTAVSARDHHLEVQGSILSLLILVVFLLIV